MSTRVTPIVALDVGNSGAALGIATELGDLCSFYKIGSELFTAEGPAVVRAVQDLGASVFLDLKLLDIPTTVRGAARSAAKLGARIITVHAQGGRPMMEAAVGAVREAGSDCEVFAVTVLTSMDAASVSSVWGHPVTALDREVLRLARLARESGADGVVCSGHEAAAIRNDLGAAFGTLIPGVRLPSVGHQDQLRVVTPGQAAASGARYIVVGRTVTMAESPRTAMAAVVADLS